FPVGSILASDVVMMETYGVSRTVLREALKTLEAKGLVEARPKVGTRVSPTSRWSFFDPQVLSWHFYAKPDRRFYESLFDTRRAGNPPHAGGNLGQCAAALGGRHCRADAGAGAQAMRRQQRRCLSGEHAWRADHAGDRRRRGRRRGGDGGGEPGDRSGPALCH